MFGWVLSDLLATVATMAVRPTATWRREDPARRSEALLARIGAALQAFEGELAALAEPSDDQIFAAVEHVVVALNGLDGEEDADFDTLDREELCEYIDQSLTEAGIDVAALAGRRGIDPAEITDEWRDW